jgi:2-succinyl-5-enolpyruvyl-6-hydroxy-3-cyclohexene-1-carboxylate synthase
MSVPTDADGTGHPDLQAAFASTLVDEWTRGGVGHAVVCPGSRSTPLAVALTAHPAMAVHVRLDERSAGFTALGMGRASGRPALVLTTSGTAAAELHAAVVEADLGAVPLIVCTADRPAELHDVGAPQTIDQTHLFGGSVRWFCDPGVADPATRTTWRSLAARSVAEAASGASGPGPVHLNLPFREPLLGDQAAGGGVGPGRPDGRPWHQVVQGPPAPPPDSVRALVDSGRLHRRRRGLIVAGAGSGDPDAVFRLADSLGWPVLAEPRSGMRLPRPGMIGAADGILRSDRFASGHRPETVLRLGEPWASKVVNGFVSASAAGGADVVVIDPWTRWRDPQREASAFIRSDPTLFCEEAARSVAALASDGGDLPRGWHEDWVGAESEARAVIGALGADDGSAGIQGPLTEPSLAHRLFARMPSASTLVVSSSMPVRDLEAFGLPRPHPPRVVANRGANGIDGVVSTALGVALVSPHPTVALLGDLAFLHDVSALVRAGGLSAPLTLVVADNDGGGIFSFLDPASSLDDEVFDVLFGTPQTADVAAVAAGFGWPVDECGDGAGTGLEECLDRRLAEGSMSVIRVRVPDRAENVAVHRRINDAIVEAVER